MTFTLHDQLARDTFLIGELGLCRLLLMNNRRFPWLILVPRIIDVREIFDLSTAQYRQLMDETSMVAKALCKIVGADKMNIAALGNQVPQLHMHVIARFMNDEAWPQPIWNLQLAPLLYTPEEEGELTLRLLAALNITKM